MKYVVMEVHESYVVTLDTNGSFDLAVNFSYQIGDQIDEIVPFQSDVQPNKRKWRPRTIVAGLLAISTCIALLIFMFPRLESPVVATIWLRYNPEYQIEIDKQGNVIEAKGVNQDAIDSLNLKAFKDKSYITITNAIIDYGIQNEKLTQDKTFEVFIDTKDDSLYSQIATELEIRLKEKLCHKEIPYQIEDIGKKHQYKHGNQQENQTTPEALPDVVPENKHNQNTQQQQQQHQEKETHQQNVQQHVPVEQNNQQQNPATHQEHQNAQPVVENETHQKRDQELHD